MYDSDSGDNSFLQLHNKSFVLELLMARWIDSEKLENF